MCPAVNPLEVTRERRTCEMTSKQKCHSLLLPLWSQSTLTFGGNKATPMSNAKKTPYFIFPLDQLNIYFGFAHVLLSHDACGLTDNF